MSCNTPKTVFFIAFVFLHLEFLYPLLQADSAVLWLVWLWFLGLHNSSLLSVKAYMDLHEEVLHCIWVQTLDPFLWHGQPHILHIVLNKCHRYCHYLTFIYFYPTHISPISSDANIPTLSYLYKSILFPWQTFFTLSSTYISKDILHWLSSFYPTKTSPTLSYADIPTFS